MSTCRYKNFAWTLACVPPFSEKVIFNMGDSHFKRHLKCPVIAGVFPAFRAGSVLQNGKHESFSKSCADFPKSCAGFSAHSLLLAESTRATFILPLVGGGGGGLQEAAQKCPLPFLGFRVTKTKSWVCVHLSFLILI